MAGRCDAESKIDDRINQLTCDLVAELVNRRGRLFYEICQRVSKAAAFAGCSMFFRRIAAPVVE